jgi:hypothetical protein
MRAKRDLQGIHPLALIAQAPRNDHEAVVPFLNDRLVMVTCD